MWLLDVLLFLLVVCYASALNKHTLGNVSSSSEPIQLEVQDGIDNVYLSPSTTLYRVVEGEQLESITCSATCIPACTYAWSTSEKTVSATDTLDLGQAERRKAGSYTCTVQNTISRFTKNGPVVSLNVIYGPNNVSLSPSFTTYSLREGEQLEVITCAATCNPACSYSWSRSGDSVSSTATLFLGQIERRDTGSYICMAWNPISRVSKYGLAVNVHVIYGPDNVSLSPSTTTYSLREGEQLEVITCTATCNPACSYSWSRSGDSVSSTATLFLGQIERRDTGSYICMAWNPISRVSKYGLAVNVHVIYGPNNVSLSPSTTTYSLREGEQLEVITCAATCNPACTYSWSRSGDSVSSTATLFLGQIERREAGTYICTARNPESSVTKDGLVVSVHVIHGPDKVSLSPSTTLYSVAEGNNIAAITCYAKCNPDCTYTWSKSGSRVSSTATLYLRQIERREDGSYICTVLNPESSISKNGPDVRVDVIYGPYVVSVSPSTTLYRVTEGNNLAAITCSATCNPACTYTWSRSGSRVSSSATLYLRQIQRREAGYYICTVLNPESSISKNGPDVRVDVICKLNLCGKSRGAFQSISL
ncbi:pregnancy-specific beta-1-glycoprotein 8-like isoform X1 [Mya arenaria]|uniref:pregnancy-specific beta-1-glycoprotein 8-like isoform X1 n=1 Tax=Mya arenaria TaxID=6604 RepID=UPI0022E43818|nr:pregnancy-specific beta-1-glycoprotein 8-like isoform X1 [Mya arenaria]